MTPPRRLSRTVLALAVSTVVLLTSTAVLGVLLLEVRQSSLPPQPPRMLDVQVSGIVDRSNVTGPFWFQFSIVRLANVSQPGSGGEVLRIIYFNVTNLSSPWPFATAAKLEAGKDYTFWVFIASGPLGTFPTPFINLQSPVSFVFRVWMANSQWEIGVTRSPSA